jgi:hypothetical protein
MMYSKGQKTTCPSCGANAFAKVEATYDGWAKTGEAFVCSECGDALEGGAGVQSNAQAAKFAAFLGTEKDQQTQVIDDSGKVGFCRDCVNYVEHPFATRCVLHDRKVEPMASCDDYEKREGAK